MDKHYLFLSKSALPKKEFEAALSGLGVDLSSLSYVSEDSGELFLPAEDYPLIEGASMPLHEDLGIPLAFLCSHDDGEFSKKLLKDALAYFPNQVVFPSDVFMKEMSFGDFSSWPYLTHLFQGVDQEILGTAGEYLRCGCNASLAAKALYVHRNTFNYRLSAFIEKTGLDIRDYHNALLLELYFQLSNGRLDRSSEDRY